MRTRTALAAILCAGCGVTAPAPAESETEQATTVCGDGPTVHGMDVSAYETSIDWPTAKAAGIAFAFIRVSDGTQYVDPKFDGYWAGARAAGVMRGAYQYFRPAEDPIAQADLMLGKLGPPQPGDLPPVIDVETTGGLAPADVAAAVQAWVDHVSAAIGRPPIIYAGFYSWQDDVGGANLTGEPLWHAQYTTAPCPNIPVPWTRWAFWQYSSTGSVPSVLGEATDLDVWNGTLAELQQFAGSGLPPCGVIAADGGIVDNGDACFSAGGPAATLRAVSDAGEGSDLIWTHATAAATEGNFAQWDLDLAEAGTYRVEVYTAAPYAQSKQAAYQVAAGSARERVVIDQSAVDGWQSLGEFPFAAGGGQWIALGDNTGETGTVQLVFDAVRLTRVDAAGSGSAGSGSAGGSGFGAQPEPGGGCAAGGDGGIGLALALLGVRVRARRCRTA